MYVVVTAVSAVDLGSVVAVFPFVFSFVVTAAGAVDLGSVEVGGMFLPFLRVFFATLFFIFLISAFRFPSALIRFDLVLQIRHFKVFADPLPQVWEVWENLLY